MLSKNQFKKYLELVETINRDRDKLDEVGIILDDQLYDPTYLLLDMVIESNFDEEGCDKFFYYMYENKNCFDDVDDLWEFMVKHYNYEPTAEISSFN